MQVIKKGHYDASPKGLVRKLSDEERRLLAETWTPGTTIWRQQQAILLQLREQEHWLLCDCPNKNSVVMFPRRNPSGTLGLVNHSDHHDHDPECPFWRLTKEGANDAGKRLKQVKQRFDFCFHRRINEDPEDEDEEKSDSPSSRSAKGDPGLVKLIYLLLALARLERFDGASHYTHESAMSRLSQAAKHLTVNKLFSVADLLYTSLDCLDEAVGHLHDTQHLWVRHGRPHAIFLITIDRFEFVGPELKVTEFHKNDGGWKTKEHLFPAHLKVVIPGRINLLEGGPYLMAFTLADPEGNTECPFYSPVKAAIIPVLTKEHPLPVDSRFERVMFKALRKQAQWHHHNRRKNLTVIKPVYDLISPLTDQPCRPDVILEHGNRKLIIEVMGSHSEEYLASKAVTLPRMEEIAEVVEFDAMAADLAGELDRGSWQCASDAIRRLWAPMQATASVETTGVALGETSTE